jgi:hypothetical protein
MSGDGPSAVNEPKEKTDQGSHGDCAPSSPGNGEPKERPKVSQAEPKDCQTVIEREERRNDHREQCQNANGPANRASADPVRSGEFARKSGSPQRSDNRDDDRGHELVKMTRQRHGARQHNPTPNKAQSRRKRSGKRVVTIERYDRLEGWDRIARVRGLLQDKNLAEAHAGPEVRVAVLNLLHNDPKGAEELEALAIQAEERLYGPGSARGRAVEVSRLPAPKLTLPGGNGHGGNGDGS